jgi:predicted nucleotidyltransferase
MVMEEVLSGKIEALAAMCRQYMVQRLEIFGSVADGTFDPERSDLDFLVTFSECSPREHYERYFGLIESLEALFSRRVDLVEESAMRNPYFIRQVNESKKLLYAA